MQMSSHSEILVVRSFFDEESIAGVGFEKKMDGGTFLALFALKRAKKGSKGKTVYFIGKLRKFAKKYVLNIFSLKRFVFEHFRRQKPHFLAKIAKSPL